MSTAPTISRDAAVDLYRQLLEAWNRRDADGFAALFTENGGTIGFDGSQMNGRDEIRSELAAIFEDHVTGKYVAKIRRVRQPAPGLMLVHAVCGIVPHGMDELNPAANAVQSAVIIPGDESAHARITLFQNTPAAFHGRPQLSDALTKELTRVLRSGRVLDPG